MYLLTEEDDNESRVPRRLAVEDTYEYMVTLRGLWGKSPDTGQRLPWRCANVAGPPAVAHDQAEKPSSWLSRATGHGVRHRHRNAGGMLSSTR